MRQSDEPITQHSCLQCKWWRSTNSVLTDIHYVLCSAYPDTTPALPPYQSVVNHNQDVFLPLDVAQLLDIAFQKKSELKVSLTVGYLYKHAVVRLLQVPGSVDGNRPVTADLPLPYLLNMRKSAASDPVSGAEPSRPIDCDEVSSHLPASKRPHAENLSSPERTVEPVKRIRAARVGTPPRADITHGAESLTLRDRFKLQKPDGGWCDAYGRSTSPISTVKRTAPKPAITMKGFITSRNRYLVPHEVSVSGHLPTGWGRFVIPADAPNGAYKSTPGDPTRLPSVTDAMHYKIDLYFADDLRVPVGTLYTDVNLQDYRRLEYRAAGVSSVVNIRSYAAALPSEEGEASQ